MLLVSREEAANAPHVGQGSFDSNWGQTIVSYTYFLGMDWAEGKWPQYEGMPLVGNPEDLAHEVAHWILASPYRRKLKNFGLGEPGYGPGGRVSIAYAEAEESLASLLGISMIYTAGNTALAKWTIQDQGWIPFFHRLKVGYSILFEAGLVSYSETPVDPNVIFIPTATFAHISSDQNLRLAAKLL